MKNLTWSMKRLAISLGCVGLVSVIAGCNESSEEKTLKEAYENYFDIGVALSPKTYQLYDASIYQEFSTVTAENEIKWESIQNSEGSFTFDSADIIADFARENKQKMRGHTIVWHSQTPSWVAQESESGSVDDTINLMLERIETHFVAMNERYGDVIFVWDVANEVISDSNDPNERYRQDSIYYVACGKDDAKFEYFLSEVFKMVERLAPDVTRYYNDYNLAWDSVKRAKTITMIENIEALGANVQGIGMQSHVNITMTKETFAQAIADFKNSALFDELSVTELDISVYTSDSEPVMNVLSEEVAQKQADIYGDLFELFRENDEFVSNVTFWGISDLATWLDNFPVYGRNNYPLLFDDNGEKKEAYYSVRDF